MLKAEKAPAAAMLEELKAHLRLEDGREDALLAGLLRAATETVEAMLGVLLLEREVEELAVVRGGIPALRAGPVTALVSASVAELGEVVELLAAGRARWKAARHEGGCVEVDGVADGVELSVRYRAGLADDWNGVPEILRLSVIRAAAHFHGHRDSVDEPGIPPGVRRMLAPWRARRLR